MAQDRRGSSPASRHRAYLEAAIERFVDRRDEFGAQILKVIQAKVAFYDAIQDPNLLSEIERDCRDHAVTVLNALASEQPLSEETIERLATIGRRRFEAGVPLDALQPAYQTGAFELARIMESLLEEVCPLPDVLPTLVAEVNKEVFALSTRLVQAISADYIAARKGTESAHAKRGPVDDLLEGIAVLIEDARARAASLGFLLGDHHIVAIVGPRDARAPGIGEPKHRRTLIGALQSQVPGGFLSSAIAPTRDQRIAVIVSTDKRPRSVRTLAKRIEEGLATVTPPVPGDLMASVGCIESGTHGIHISYRQALAALCVAGETRRVALYEDVMPALLIQDSPLRAQDFVRQLAIPLLEHDRRSRAKLIESLKAYLSAGGNTARAAKALRIHPRTLMYRFRQIEKLTGCRVENPTDLTRLVLALEALSLYPPEETGI